MKLELYDQVDFCPFRGPEAPFALGGYYHGGIILALTSVNTWLHQLRSLAKRMPEMSLQISILGKATRWTRDLVNAAIAITDEDQLHKTMEELRSALHDHIQRVRQIGLASHPDRRSRRYGPPA